MIAKYIWPFGYKCQSEHWLVRKMHLSWAASFDSLVRLRLYRPSWCLWVHCPFSGWSGRSRTRFWTNSFSWRVLEWRRSSIFRTFHWESWGASIWRIRGSTFLFSFRHVWRRCIGLLQSHDADGSCPILSSWRSHAKTSLHWEHSVSPELTKSSHPVNTLFVPN